MIHPCACVPLRVSNVRLWFSAHKFRLCIWFCAYVSKLLCPGQKPTLVLQESAKHSFHLFCVTVLPAGFVFLPLHLFFIILTFYVHIIKLLSVYLKKKKKSKPNYKNHHPQQDGEPVSVMSVKRHERPSWKMRHTRSPSTCTCIHNLCPISVAKLLSSVSTFQG